MEACVRAGTWNERQRPVASVTRISSGTSSDVRAWLTACTGAPAYVPTEDAVARMSGDPPLRGVALPTAQVVRPRHLYRVARSTAKTNRLIVRLLRRLTAALSGLLIFSLTLMGSGTLCAVRGTGATATTHHMSAMTGMATSALATAPSATGARAPDGTDVPPTSGQSDEGCGMPWAPGQCTSMTLCTMAAIPSATLVIALDARPMAADLPMPGDLGSRPASPPELPPPRA